MDQKRDVSKTVKMTWEDWENFQEAFRTIDPYAPFNASKAILALARRGAAEVLKGRPKPPHKVK